jgi:uncharacterized protein (DUF1015 family)
MPLDVRPLQALRYDPARFKDISDLTAPPYDVINADMRAALLAKSPHNIVAADLPQKSGTDFAAGVGDEEAPYRKSAELLAGWQAAGVLVRDREPRMHLYTQEFTVGGVTRVRTGLLCRIRLAEFGEGVIRPHEQTFSGPKRDRLLLTRATKTQLSPIFGMFPDPTNAVLGPLADLMKSPEQTATDVFGVTHRTAPLPAAEVERVRSVLADKTLYIADGHHRYETALNYRRELIESGKMRPDDADHPANYVQFVIISMHDPGMIIQPTHRLLKWKRTPSSGTLISALQSVGTVTPTKRWAADFAGLDADINAPGMEGAIGVYITASDQCLIWKPSNADPLASVAPDKSPAWRRLDVAVLHELIINRAIKEAWPDEFEISYPHDAATARELTTAGDRHIAFLLRPTPMEALIAVTGAREVMPQKSTYFYPKMLTGLALNPVG